MYKAVPERITQHSILLPPATAGSEGSHFVGKEGYSNENQAFSQTASVLNSSNYGGFKVGTSSYNQKTAMAEVFNNN